MLQEYYQCIMYERIICGAVGWLVICDSVISWSYSLDLQCLFFPNLVVFNRLYIVFTL